MQIKVWFAPTATAVLMLLATLLADMPSTVLAQSNEPIFELPVQLVGFPVIILAVRLSNFVKKLSYSLNPQTYQSRSRRSTPPLLGHLATPHVAVSRSAIDTAVAEKQILSELGPKACIMEEPCRIHAARPGQSGDQPDWTDILQHYKVQATGMKQWYLLSVFVGDVMRDVPLCKRLAKRLPCGRRTKEVIRD